ncbi:MAG: FAD-dependent oxidoreductase [Oscillospiraceae bacterium]|jgi:fumarate reductase flavoprotein subunit
MDKETRNVDVCVLGGAGAGLTAALRAKEEGAESVLLLEKMKILGGCTRLAQEMFAVGTPIHERTGTKTDVDECYLQHMRQSLWRPNSRLVRKWYTNIGKVVAWQEAHGIEYEESVRAGSGTTKAMIDPKGGGNAIINTMEKAARAAGVEIMLNTRAYKLLTDEGGAVTGVLAKQGENEIQVNAKSVIVATGSISNNKELLDRMYPGEDYHLIKRMAAVPHNTGDGLIMCEEIGCKPGPMHTLYIGPHNHPSNMRVGNIMRRYMMIYVNREGERFVNEAIPATEDWGWMKSVAQDRQPGHKCYPLMDESIFRRMLKEHCNYTRIEEKQGSMAAQNMLANYGKNKSWDEGLAPDSTSWLDMLEDDFREEEKKGKLKICQTLDEVAEWIGADPKTLKQTVRTYNEFCEKGYDADFLKDPRYLWPLTTPPYYVFEGQQGIDTCIGGITIDHNTRVLNKELRPIKNLYAAGACTSGWANNAYGFFGSCMSLSFFSGWYAGREAALNARKNE